MNKKILVAAAAVVVLLSSCQTVSTSKQTPDERAIAQGVAAWNNREPAAARPFWSSIKEEVTRNLYTGYVDTFDAGSKSLADALSAGPGDGARIQASYEKARKAFAALPDELPIPDELRADAVAVAAGRMRSLIDADKLADAREVGKGAVESFGGSDAISLMDAEIGVVTSSRKREAGADAALQKARDASAFDQKIAALEAASAAYAHAGDLLAADGARAGVSKSASVAREASRLRTKGQGPAIEREKLLREHAYALKDRIGAEFARVPEEDKVGAMSLQQLLAHQESVKENVEAAYTEMRQFAARYPEVADPELMAQVETQKQVLDDKIAEVNQEIRTAQEIESRGKVVMPVMIGLFNPEPGTTAEAAKSRPGVFQATGVKGNDYWWGMVSIPRGTMNDLVVTVSDSRAVRVFSDNTKSGSLIRKNNMRDLVNRAYRVGNSWPVLNAGNQLASDKYFFEIEQGKTPTYEGEVVVYRSFVMRMR